MLAAQSYDVAVVGGGIVGLTTACGLADLGLRVIVIDQGSVDEVSGEPRLKVSAINQASQNLLKNIGAWSYIDKVRCTSYTSMKIWDKGGAGKIHFDDNGSGQSLGTIIENDVISNALLARAEDLHSLTYVENQTLDSVVFGEREAWLTLNSREQFSAALVVAADGANSVIREKCRIPLTFWDYGHHAIVATIRTEYSHQHCAQQIFTEEGVLAFLPLFDSNLCSIVWSTSPQKATELMECGDSEFNKALTAAFEGRLGLCHIAGNKQKQCFPLKMRYARQFVQNRMILAGDAAHTVHPLAGQGMNLGLLDAASIIEVVGDIFKQGKDIGEYRYLRNLERWQKANAIEMIAAMEGLKQLFAGGHPVKKTFRDMGLNFIDKLPFVKNKLIEKAMGKSLKIPLLCINSRDEEINSKSY